MAFTFSEFLPGALLAWSGVVAIAPLVTVITSMLVRGRDPWDFSEANDFVFVVFEAAAAAMIYYAPFALAALIVAGIPLGFLLGRVLSRTPSVVVHATTFALLGAATGAVASALVIELVDARWFAWTGIVPVFTNTIVTSLVVVASWWLAVRSALREDARRAEGSITAERGDFEQETA